MTYTIHECVLKTNKGLYLVVESGIGVVPKYFHSRKDARNFIKRRSEK